MELSLSEVILRLVVATVLSGLIGLERELRQKPAGVRTSALVGLGAAMMTLSGVYSYSLWPDATDPSRIASIVIQGIGFLGAGVIIQSAGAVRGLTTAATMWVIAGIGIAVGFGLYLPAVSTGLIALVLLIIFGPIDARLMGTEEEMERRGWFFQKKGKKEK